MEPIDGVAAQPIRNLAGQLAGIRTSLPAAASLQQVFTPIPFPLHFTPVTTPLVRGGTTIGYVVTGGGQQAPTSASVTLASGTLWFDASLLGPAFASSTALVGVPFAHATLKTAGAVTFGAAGITLDPAATLTLSVTSRSTPLAAPAGDAIGRDFQGAKLTAFPGATVTFAPGTGAGSATVLPTGQATAALYGQTVALAPKPGAAAAELDLPTPFAAIPCTPSPATFAPTGAASAEFGLGGSAPVLTGGLLFPVVELGSATPATLPEPAEAWAAAFGAGPGLTVQLAGVAHPTRLAGAVIALTPQRLAGLTALQGRAARRYRLWSSPGHPLLAANAAFPDLPRPQPEVTLDLPIGAAIGFSFTPTAETVLAGGLLSAVVDQPVAADGSRIALAGHALELRTLTAAKTTVDIGSPLTPKAETSIAIDTPNAIIPVGTPNGFFVNGTLVPGSGPPTLSGRAEVVFPAEVVIPTLPHPYAAAYLASPRTEQIVGVAALVTWSAIGPTSPAALSIALIRPSDLAVGRVFAAAGGATAAGSPAATVPGANLVGAPAPAPGPDATLASTERVGGVGFALLDVSSFGSQWGVAVLGAGVPQLSFHGIELQAPSADTMVFTVPGISWEPVVDGTQAFPQWFDASSPTDGTPTTFLVSTGTDVPLFPLQVLDTYTGLAGKDPTAATFTLPFGITARLVDGPGRQPGTPAAGTGPATYAVPKLQFPEAGMAGAAVLSVRATATDPGPPASPLLATPTLPGSATVGTFSPTLADNSYGSLVMGATPAQLAPADFFNQAFNPGGNQGGIPVGRIDLSGYGTSMFSDWSWTDPKVVGVVRANFDVLLGRTAHELVEFQTWILPWCIRIQRTVVFDRSDGGEVIRHDTGWVAVGAGAFELLDASTLMAARPVVKLDAIHNLTFPGTAVVTFNGREYAPVVFDATVFLDAGLKVDANGKTGLGAIPAGAIQGWAVKPVVQPPPPAPRVPPVPPSAADIIGMLQQVHRVAGTTAGIARVGGTGPQQFTMTLASFAAGVTSTNNMLQVALFGAPRLPKDGQWSVARRVSTAKAPTGVPQGTPVPLTRGLPPATPPTGAETYHQGWRLLDPEDAQSPDAPATFYSLLQGTGTAKTLFEHPLVGDTGQKMGFAHKPSLADVGALLGVGGLFPDLGSILQIPDLDSVPLQADGFSKTYSWDIDQPDRTLLDLGIVHLVLSYKATDGDGTTTKAHAILKLDATPGAPNWAISLTNISVQAVVDGFGSTPSCRSAAGSRRVPGCSPALSGHCPTRPACPTARATPPTRWLCSMAAPCRP
ncbi:MAG TPA: hypothetical protein VFW71_04325 [Actinomycetota bacterium]|nr:hypothetical protein [Actinomycetota bacterium]